MRLLALLLVAACVGTTTLPEAPSPTAPRVKIVRGVGMFTSTHAWERTPWARTTDSPADLPVMIVVADDNSACIVPGSVWALAKQGDRYSCPQAWRFPR